MTDLLVWSVIKVPYLTHFQVQQLAEVEKRDPFQVRGSLLSDMRHLNPSSRGHINGPVDVIFCSDFANSWNHCVKPPHSVSLDGSDLVLKRPQHLQI